MNQADDLNRERSSANDEPGDGPVAGADWHLAARILLSAALLGAALYTLSNYVRALLWALVIGIALWPLFQKVAHGASARVRKDLLPAAFTIAVALVFVLPFVALAAEAVREAHTVLEYGRQAEQNGIPAPQALSRLPAPIAQPLTRWWDSNLHSGWAKELSARLDTASNLERGRSAGLQVIHRIILFGFAMLALFFLLRESDAFADQCRTVSHRLFGERGERIGYQMIASVHGTINGLVLVGLGEGVLLGVVYALCGVPHAILFGAFTAVAAMVPFATVIAIGLAALIMLVAGNLVSAIIIIVAGLVTTLAADHFVRPSLIGSVTRLPFLWVLLGILGGVESFGLLGLFLGPAIMAAAIFLWRELSAR